MHLQRTIKHEINCRNIGLHSGRKVSMTIKPSGVDEGIVFIRKDLPGNVRIKADFENVRDTILATTIGLNGAPVSTVEHLLSALCGMGVDNAVVEVDAAEIPIMDGSALPFVNLLKDVGTTIQDKCKKLLVIQKRISVSEGDGTAMLLLSFINNTTFNPFMSYPMKAWTRVVHAQTSIPSIRPRPHNYRSSRTIPRIISLQSFAGFYGYFSFRGGCLNRRVGRHNNFIYHWNRWIAFSQIINKFD